jgi:hypothetical protein
MCFGYNHCMVALTNKSANFPQRPLRVRAQNHRYRLRAERCSKSSGRANLREATYAECDRLESCSKDPIGYWDSFSLYEATFPLSGTDPSGLICQDKKRPCADKDGKGGLDEDTEKVYELCMALCKWSFPKIKYLDELDPCKLCEELPGPAQPMCKYLCKEAKKHTPIDDIPDPVEWVCDKACCSGKLPDGIPWNNCVARMFDDHGKPKGRTGVSDCLWCCEDTVWKHRNHKTLCKKACNAMGGGY